MIQTIFCVTVMYVFCVINLCLLSKGAKQVALSDGSTLSPPAEEACKAAEPAPAADPTCGSSLPATTTSSTAAAAAALTPESLPNIPNLSQMSIASPLEKVRSFSRLQHFPPSGVTHEKRSSP